MAPLTPNSAAALARLRAYSPPPFPTWSRLPVSRRAAVLLLLFADRRGELRVVLTMRSATLRSFSGQAAFPGGKADSLEESAFDIARREAWEEIGLPLDDSKILRPFRIEHLCQLPYSLSKTALAVRPCVAFLHADDVPGMPSASVEESMIPRLDAKEVAAVFSAPFYNFLKLEDEVHEGDELPGDRSDWYDGKWLEWLDGRWRMHNFYVPITNQKVTKAYVRESGQAAIAEQLDEDEDAGLTRYRVWGMTARMLVDAARLAYNQDPEFEFNSHIGDEDTIETLERSGKMGGKPSELSESEIRAAKIASSKGVSKM